MAFVSASMLTAAFFIASRPARAQNMPQHPDSAQAQVQDFRQPGHTYWQHPEYDAVMDVWTDAKGIRFRVHSFNPMNPKVREMIAKGEKKKPEDLTLDDIRKFANYEATLVGMKEKSPGRWEGKIWVESRKEHFGIDIQLPQGAESNLRIRGYIVEGWKRVLTLGNPGNIVGRTLEFTPVEHPPAPGLLFRQAPAPAPRAPGS